MYYRSSHCALSRNFNTIDKVFTVIVLDTSTLLLLHTIPHEEDVYTCIVSFANELYTEKQFFT